MDKLPVYATDLVRELNASIPPRCVGSDESMQSAHRYAGKRELVEALLRRLNATQAAESDPTASLLEGSNVLR